MLRSITTGLGLMLTLFAKSALATTIALPPFFSENMVLPSDCRFILKGKAEPLDNVDLYLNNQLFRGVANSDGQWQIEINPLSSIKNIRMEIKSANAGTKSINQVSAGEVWLCGGQSNMVVPVSYASDGGNDAFSDSDDIRFYINGKWIKVDKNNYKNMQAVPYFLARERSRLTGKVIGIIVAAQGGTGIEAWMPQDAMPDSKTGEKMRALASVPEVIEAAKLDGSEKMRPYGQHRLAKWGLGRAYPSELYQKYVLPIAGIPVNGIVWYQGESNAYMPMAQEYDLWLKGLVSSWRKLFSDVPFMVVELPKYAENPQCRDALRSSQKKFVDSSANTYYIPAYDLGDDQNIHPVRKRAMGKRIAEFIQSRNIKNEKN